MFGRITSVSSQKKETLPEWIPVKIQEEDKEKKVKPRDEDKEITRWEPIEPTEEKKDFKKADEAKVKAQSDDGEKSLVINQEAVQAFKSVKTIDEKTATLFYEHGYTSPKQIQQKAEEELVKTGVKKRTVKKIKKELQKTEKKTKKAAKPLRRKKTKPQRVQRSLPDTAEPPRERSEVTLEEKHRPFTYGEYGLYKKEISTADGKTRTIHFFSKKKPDEGEPVPLPEEYEVQVNQKTGLPYLKKKA